MWTIYLNWEQVRNISKLCSTAIRSKIEPRNSRDVSFPSPVIHSTIYDLPFASGLPTARMSWLKYIAINNGIQMHGWIHQITNGYDTANSPISRLSSFVCKISQFAANSQFNEFIWQGRSKIAWIFGTIRSCSCSWWMRQGHLQYCTPKKLGRVNNSVM